MPNLSPSGEQLVRDLAQRHGVSSDAATHMLIAVSNGNGTMAQFSHPEFGGSGQWMRGGMTMVSDLFNNHLKSRVDNICSDISNCLADHQLVPFSGSFQSQSQNGQSSQTQASGNLGSQNSLFAPDPESNWWPAEIGVPNATGSQNQVKYAYFAQTRRLAVKTGPSVWVYDTLDHQIGGFSQQQGFGGSITFSSQFGTVNLSQLPVVYRDGEYVDPTPPPVTSPSAPSVTIAPASDPPTVPQSPVASPAPGSENIFETLERLGGLKEKGYISEEEFTAKKTELLGRL